MARTNWKQANGTVVDVKWISTRGRVQFTVMFSYEVDGERFGGGLYTFDRMKENDPIIVKYDASNPARNYFEVKQQRINRVSIVVAILFVFIVASLVYFTYRR